METYDPEDFAGLPFRLLPEEEEKKYYARYGGSKDSQYGDSQLVSVKVQINGKDYFEQTHVQLELTQSIYGEHQFQLTADPDEFGEGSAYLLQHSREHLGSRITLQFRQSGSTASVFTGIITQLSTSKKDGIKQVILRGKSPSMLMENGRHCRSFEQKTLEEIIKQVSRNYPRNLIQFDVNPNYKEKLAYTTQYNQSDYQFLQSLAARYGEYFYYSGEQFIFSAWGGKIVELVEGEDIYDFELKMEVQPQKFSYTAYDPQQGTSYTTASQNQRIQPSENPFQQFAQNASEQIFNVEPTGHFTQNLLPQNQLDMQKTMEREGKKRQNLVFMEATTNHPGLQVGDIVKMMAWMPGHETFKSGKVPIESYKIIEITHRFADGEGYSNSLIGVPRDLTVPLLFEDTLFPKADLQHATVTDNQDPLKMGRVRVQFVWQQTDNEQTPWIQVIQPHAGTGKGTYFNPEIGETVLCAFQGGNAECPIVLGTAYNGGEIAAYYTQGNDVKVIQTRSGTKIIFNDAEGQGSILIEDPSGNTLFLDGEGNIKVHAPETLFMDARNVVVSASQNISLSAGENISVMAGEDYNLAATNIFESAGSYRESKAKEIVETSEKGTYSADTDLVRLESGSMVKSNSAQQTSLH
ncbi:phage baseplate assembly protein V [Apibacter raozihei]|uniref:type VI secretion system Vgr family protein n=1 Tax=Apibacter raozihei TaxID=2500547 RepID=UPI000FE394BC|nr:phage baseplate assembly protein V [Apibacter raozihei]